MGYAQWTEINIVNHSAKPLSIQNAEHESGKFYACENGCQSTLRYFGSFSSDQVAADKNVEISVPDIDSKNVAPSKEYKIGACGKENATMGCEGKLEL